MWTRLPISLPVFSSLFLLGCTASAEYGLSAPVEANAAGWDTIRISADVALQRHGYGADVGRCQVQVAFEPVVYADAPAEPPEEPWAVAEPDQPGTCALSVEPVAEPGGEAGDPGDDWYVSGSLVGPERIELRGGQVDLVLEPVEAEDGGVRYELPADRCSDADFPVGEVFDLVVPEGEGDDALPGFVVLDALVVGPDVALTAPSLDGLDGDRVPHAVQDDLFVAWELSGGIPQVAGVPVEPQVQVKVYNQDEEHALPSEWVVCLPDQDGAFTLPADTLAELTVNPTEQEDRWFASVTVHTTTQSPAFETPWGEPVQLQAHVSEGGFVVFHE